MGFYLQLGCSALGTPLRWENAANPHIFISGQSGMGKSYFLKNCIAQLPSQNVRCIVFDYSGDFIQPAANYFPELEKCRKLDVEKDIAINPFRQLQVSTARTERKTDIASRIAEAIIRSYRVRGNMQEVYLRNALKNYLERETKNPCFSGLSHMIQSDSELSKKMASTLIRIQDLSDMIPTTTSEFHWDTTDPGITIVSFDSLPNASAQALVTTFLLTDLWSEHISSSERMCPVIVVLDECQRLQFTEDSIYCRILREGRKNHFGGWFASQWISNKTALEALNQAALRAYFFPGENQIHSLAKRLCNTGDSATLKPYKQLIQRLRVGDFIYQDERGRPIKCHVSERGG